MIKASTKTETKGKALVDKIKKTAADMMSDPYVTIGFYEDAGEYKSGVSVVEVAFWNEFGTETSPSRSFIRSTMDAKSEKINSLRDQAMKKIEKGEWDVAKALEFMGLNIQILIQNAIKSNIPPENAPSTQKAKAAKGVPNRTLIDSTLLLRSIRFRTFP